MLHHQQCRHTPLSQPDGTSRAAGSRFGTPGSQQKHCTALEDVIVSLPLARNDNGSADRCFGKDNEGAPRESINRIRQQAASFLVEHVT